MIKLKFDKVWYQNASEARLGKAYKKIQKAGEATTQDVVTIGKEYARILVPKGTTGWLYKSIQGKVITKNKGAEGLIFLKPAYLPNDGVHRRKFTGQNWKYVRFNLAKWMHTSPKAGAHFTSGDHKFMYTTKKMLNAKAGSITRKHFAGIKL